VPGHGDIVDRAFVARQLAEITVVADLIRELHREGVERGSALAAGRGRWPFPAERLGEAVAVGYALLARDPNA
jgi:hypothetical protein